MYLCIYVHIYIYICVCIYVSMYLCMCIYIYLSIYLSIHPSIYLSIYLSIPLSLALVAEPRSYPMKTPKSESPASIASPRALVTKAPLATARNLPTAQGGMLPCVWGHGWPGNLIRMNRINHDWLVVSTPPKNISQLG